MTPPRGAGGALVTVAVAVFRSKPIYRAKAGLFSKHRQSRKTKQATRK